MIHVEIRRISCQQTSEINGIGRRCPDRWAGDKVLETAGFTHLAGDSLLTTTGDNMIGWRHLACVVSIS